MKGIIERWRRMYLWEKLLVIVLFPIWLPMLVVVLAVFAAFAGLVLALNLFLG